MMRDILLLVCSCSVVVSQNVARMSSLSETAFGDKTFLPEIIPLSVKKSFTENGEPVLTIDVIYSDDFVITWVSHGNSVSYIDRVYSPSLDTVPSEYTLKIYIPTQASQLSNVSATSSFSKHETLHTTDDVFRMEDDDFLIDNNELYIHFETMNPPEAVVLKLSVGDKEFDNDKPGNANLGIDEAVPKFPEMQELGVDVVTVTEGSRTQVPIHVLFTENDRFSVRGLVYNSSSNRLFTTFWSTNYLLGPSDFYQISSDNNNDSNAFHDNVKLEKVDSDESSRLRQISIDIPTENNDISGVYTIRAHHEASIADPSFISVSTLEQTFIVQRENQTHGPIPPGVVDFIGGPYSLMTCRIGAACLVSCHVLGVGVHSLQLMHKDEHSEFVGLPRQVVDYGTYESQVFVLVDSTQPDNSGTYLCKAVSGQTSKDKEIDVIFVNH